MYIDKFRKYIVNNKTRVECVINKVNKILIECDEKYIDGVQETYDGFLVLVLVVAMKKKENISINGFISYKLYYNLVNHVMPIIKVVHPTFEIIKIDVKGFTEDLYDNNNAVGCGLSCGVDSLCCIEDYFFKNVRPSLKLTHLTNFYAGATNNKTVYKNRLIHIEKYAEEVQLDFLQVNTNFIKINNLEHQYFHTLRNLSVPLFFQKLFKRYYYASSFSYSNSKIVPDSGSITSCEPVLIPLLSTENIDLQIHGAQYSRLRKTAIISKNPLSYKYLDVCVHPTYYETIKDKINCSKCYKCLRTCATLDYFNVLDKYDSVFDIELYKMHKQEFLLGLEQTNPYDRELKSRYYFDNKLYLNIKSNIDLNNLDKLEYIDLTDKNNIIKLNNNNSDDVNHSNEKTELDDVDHSNETTEQSKPHTIFDIIKNKINSNEQNSETNKDSIINIPKLDSKDKNLNEYNNSNKSIQNESFHKNIESLKNNQKFNKIISEDNLFQENDLFHEYLMSNINKNDVNLVNNVKKEITQMSENNNLDFKISCEEESSQTNFNPQIETSTVNNTQVPKPTPAPIPAPIPAPKKIDRIWWAFRKDWEHLKKANQIRALKDCIVKKNKDLHSKFLTSDQKINYKKGKLFKLEPSQDNELYYKIKI